MLAVGCDRADVESAATQDEAETSAACTSAPSRSLRENTRFFAPTPSKEARSQVMRLLRAHDARDAAALQAMEYTPHGVWFTGGTPAEVEKSVRHTMREAARLNEVPILVAYNLPYRDCAQYSAGGAVDTAAYEAWIDGFARGLGKGKAVVILEPDGLGIIPYNTTIYGSSDWCKPTIVDASGATIAAPGATPDQRYAQLNYAVDSIETKAPQAAVYLDGTHSAWLGFGEAAYRLAKAGIDRAQGFFLNTSNYQLTSELVQYGTWISDALVASKSAPTWAYDDAGNFHFDWLPSQYDPATDYQAVNYSAEFVASVNEALQGFLNGATPTTHFVIDTSRNGQGPLDPSRYAAAPYDQPASVVSSLNSGNWCNPPGAGLGLRPTAKTEVALADAYLWIKVPGESDGACDIAGGARAWDYAQYNPWSLAPDAQSHFDPLWGMVDPAAGAWFAEQALELTRNASPAFF